MYPHTDHCFDRTKLIDDAKSPNPKYRGLIHGTASIVREEGLRGIYRGLFPVVCNEHVSSIMVTESDVDIILPDDAARYCRATAKHFRASTHTFDLGANSAVRFTTYTTLKQFVQSTARPGQQLPSGITFGIGAIAGLVTVYTTMPLECVISLIVSWNVISHGSSISLV